MKISWCVCSDKIQTMWLMQVPFPPKRKTCASFKFVPEFVSVKQCLPQTRVTYQYLNNMLLKVNPKVSLKWPGFLFNVIIH